nr:hypothetical protein [Tanacetum cinerariifolium]
MVAYLNKSDASEGFNQVIDFLNGSYIKYALIVNPTIYVTCIKQFWNTVVVKQSNDVTRVGKGFSGVETPLFEGMLIAGEPEEQGDDVQDQSIPLPTPPTPPPQQPQDLPSTSQEALDDCVALTRRVEHLEHDKVAQDLEIIKLKTRVKKLERANKVKALKLKRLKKVVTVASESVTAASTTISAAEPQVPTAAITTAAPDIDWSVSIDHVKQKAKEDSYVQRYQLLKAIEKRFGGDAASKMTQRNLLKQQYKNFTALSSEMLDQTFDRIQNLKTHAVVWINKANMDTMSMDNLYNNLNVYEREVNGMFSSSSSTQNMSFVSSSNNNSSSINGTVNTAQAVNTVDEADEGPNYALMAFTSSSSDSKASNDSTCSKSCLKTVTLLKSQNE